MASPFNVFRKHQRIMIAILGIVAMVAFVLLDPLMQVLGVGSAPRDNPVIATTKYGALREYDIQRMLAERRILNQFLQQAYIMGIQAGATEQADPRPFMHEETERGVVETMLTAKKAEELGFVVSDDAVIELIKGITGNAVRSDQLRRLIAGASLGDRTLTMGMIFDALRQAMLAARFRGTLVAAMYETPAESWNAFSKTSDQVTIEAVPVKVEQFVDQIPDPSEVELKDFFEKYKDRDQQLVAVEGLHLQPREPGFRQPAKAAFQYVRVEFDPLSDQLAKEVTEEEIVEYYNQNEESYRIPELLPADGGDSATESQDESATSGAGEGAEKDGSTQPPDAKTDVPQREHSADSAEGKKGGDEDVPGDSGNSEDNLNKTADGEQASIKLSRLAAGNSPAMLAFYQDDAADSSSQKEDVASEKDSTEKSKENGDAANEPSGEGATNEREQADESDAMPESDPQKEPAAPKSDDEKSDSEKGDSQSGNDSTLPETLDLPETIDDLPHKTGQPRYYSLDEERESIRREIAEGRVAERRDQLLAPLRDTLMQFHTQYLRWRVENEPKEEGTRDPVPFRPDLAALAKKAGMEFFQTEMLSQQQLSEIPLGEARIAGEARPFAEVAFSPAAMDDFRPVVCTTLEGDGFLVWRIEQSTAFVPTLDQIRDEVVHAWKMIEARKPAEKEADAFAAAAREKKLPLTEVFGGDSGHEVITTDPFSWLTQGSVPLSMSSNARLSSVYGIDDAGPDFMEKVFSLKPDEIAVVPNFPQTVYYVVRLVSHAANDEGLHESFLRQGPWQQLAREENYYQVRDVLREEIERGAKLQWHKVPDGLLQ